jgi:hypothetical protein
MPDTNVVTNKAIFDVSDAVSNSQALADAVEQHTNTMVKGFDEAGKAAVRSGTVMRMQAMESRAAFQMLGAEIGMRLPMHLSRWLSSLESVAPIMAGAFSAVMVIGLAEQIGKKLVEAIDWANDKLAGISKTTKAVADDSIAEVKRMETAWRGFLTEQGSLKSEGLEGTSKLREQLAQNTAEAGRLTGEIKEVGKATTTTTLGKIIDPGAAKALDAANVEAITLKTTAEEASTGVMHWLKHIGTQAAELVLISNGQAATAIGVGAAYATSEEMHRQSIETSKNRLSGLGEIETGLIKTRKEGDKLTAELKISQQEDLIKRKEDELSHEKATALQQVEAGKKAIDMGVANFTIGEAEKTRLTVANINERALVEIEMAQRANALKVQKAAISKTPVLGLEDTALIAAKAQADETAAVAAGLAARRKMDETDARNSAEGEEERVNASTKAAEHAAEEQVRIGRMPYIILGQAREAEATKSAVTFAGQEGMIAAVQEGIVGNTKVYVSTLADVQTDAENARFKTLTEKLNTERAVAVTHNEQGLEDVKATDAKIEAERIRHLAALTAITAENTDKQNNFDKGIMDAHLAQGEMLAAADVAATKESADHLLAIHAITAQGRAGIEIEALGKQHQIQIAAANQEIAEAEMLHGRESAEFIKAKTKELEEEKKYQLAVKTFQDQYAFSWAKTIATVGDKFNTGFNSWMTGQKTFGAAMKQVWDGVASNMIMNMVKMAEQMAISYALHRAFAISEINLTAWNAAVGAYNALIGIPYVGPVLANVAFYGTYAFISGVAGSLAGGGVIPATDNYRLHENEMVMDPKLSGFIQKSFAGGEGGGAGGDQHLHYHAGQNESPSSVARNLEVLKRAKKDGKLKFLFAH